jgi:hypothetical protein
VGSQFYTNEAPNVNTYSAAASLRLHHNSKHVKHVLSFTFLKTKTSFVQGFVFMLNFRGDMKESGQRLTNVVYFVVMTTG